MSKIILNTTQSKIIDDCCKKLDIKDDFETNTTLYDNVTELSYICTELQIGLNHFENALTDIKLSIADHDTEKLVQSLKQISDLTYGFSQSEIDIRKATKEAVANFKSVSEKLSFILLCDDEHIKKILDDNLHRYEDTSLLIDYKDGEYALIFCEIIDEIEQPPFSINIIAKGEEDSYDDVQAYIEKFLDL